MVCKLMSACDIPAGRYVHRNSPKFSRPASSQLVPARLRPPAATDYTTDHGAGSIEPVSADPARQQRDRSASSGWGVIEQALATTGTDAEALARQVDSAGHAWPSNFFVPQPCCCSMGGSLLAMWYRCGVFSSSHVCAIRIPGQHYTGSSSGKHALMRLCSNAIVFLSSCRVARYRAPKTHRYQNIDADGNVQLPESALMDATLDC